MGELKRRLIGGVHLTILMTVITGLITGAVFLIRFCVEARTGDTADGWWIIPVGFAYFYSMGVVNDFASGRGWRRPEME